VKHEAGIVDDVMDRTVMQLHTSNRAAQLSSLLHEQYVSLRVFSVHFQVKLPYSAKLVNEPKQISVNEQQIHISRLHC